MQYAIGLENLVQKLPKTKIKHHASNLQPPNHRKTRQKKRFFVLPRVIILRINRCYLPSISRPYVSVIFLIYPAIGRRTLSPRGHRRCLDRNPPESCPTPPETLSLSTLAAQNAVLAENALKVIAVVGCVCVCFFL